MEKFKSYKHIRHSSTAWDCVRRMSIMVLAVAVLFTCANIFAQESVGKEYVPILPDQRVQVTIKPLALDMRARAGEMPLEISPIGFWKSQRTLAKEEYDFIELDIEAPSHTTEVGNPMIPTTIVEIDIPVKAKVKGVVLRAQVLRTLEDVTISPAQEPLPLVENELIFEAEVLTKNEELYKSEEAFPGKYYEIIGTEYYGGRKLLLLRTYPVQYYPATKKLEFCKLTGKVELEVEQDPKTSAKRDVLGPLGKEAGLPLYNPGDAESWAEYEREIGSQLLEEFGALEKEMEPLSEPGVLALPAIPNVIICADLFYCPAKDLAAYYTGKGVRTIAVRSKLIEKYISGKDAPDKIRNYLRVLYKNYKTRWVTLFGDVGRDPMKVYTVPTRMAVDPAPYGSIDDGKIPCDYYYACLDGNWDSNHNGKYAELADKPDLLPELFVGRIPTQDLDEALGIVARIKLYQNNPPARRGALLAANDLGWGGHEVVFKEKTIRPLLPGSSYPAVWRLYQKWNNLSLSTFANVFNKGVDVVEYFGHGSPTSTQLMNAAQVATVLQSKPSWPVVFALSCSTSRYDNRECFGEAWVEKWKASSYIGSTRVAYGGLSTGEGLDIRFLNYFRILRRSGASLDIAKYSLFKSYGWNKYTLKTILEFTLFGDAYMLHMK
ncbi:MAG: hypothetical protein GY845_35230 [Planctomycetes bacterium]|nr:hypothetical protein [Planctomycetota bacterium]